MIVSRLSYPLKVALQQLASKSTHQQVQRHMAGTYFRSGAIKPKPEEMPFGLVAIICAVIPGLFVGATISKNIANFLEENDLFVPSDDDDDDDD